MDSSSIPHSGNAAEPLPGAWPPPDRDRDTRRHRHRAGVTLLQPAYVTPVPNQQICPLHAVLGPEIPFPSPSPSLWHRSSSPLPRMALHSSTPFLFFSPSGSTSEDTEVPSRWEKAGGHRYRRLPTRRLLETDSLTQNSSERHGCGSDLGGAKV